jgi:hypothetical protein
MLAIGGVALFLVYRTDQPPRLSGVSCHWLPKSGGVTSERDVSNPSPFPGSFVIRLQYTIADLGTVQPDLRVYVSTPPFETRHWRETIDVPKRVVGNKITSCAPTVSRGAGPSDD